MGRKEHSKVYKSFDDIRQQFGLKPVRMQTKDKEKLESQRKNFSSKHKCPACGCDLTYIDGTNVMVCKNPECEGIKREKKDSTKEETKVWYDIPYHTLDQKGAEIAHNIFKN